MALDPVTGILSVIDSVIEKVIPKFWMDKGEKEKIELTREELQNGLKLALKELHQSGELKKEAQVFQESDAQRNFQLKQFGSAEVLKNFVVGQIIMLGRSSIRWIIVGWAAYQTDKIVGLILTTEVINALVANELSAGATWLVTLIVVCIIGLPLAYVTGISIEKLMKSRGII